MAEHRRRTDSYDPATRTLLKSLPVPGRGINYTDWSAELAYFIATCEFSGQFLQLDTTTGRSNATLVSRTGPCPKDIRLSPDGTRCNSPT